MIDFGALSKRIFGEQTSEEDRELLAQIKDEMNRVNSFASKLSAVIDAFENSLDCVGVSFEDEFFEKKVLDRLSERGYNLNVVHYQKNQEVVIYDNDKLLQFAS